jgi:hypothetical protein
MRWCAWYQSRSSQRARSGNARIRFPHIRHDIRHEPCWFSLSLENAGGVKEVYEEKEKRC